MFLWSVCNVVFVVTISVDLLSQVAVFDTLCGHDEFACDIAGEHNVYFVTEKSIIGNKTSGGVYVG